MSDKDANKGNQNVGERGYRDPGLRGVRTTTLFRAVNPELFIKPVRILVYVASMANTFCIFLAFLVNVLLIDFHCRINL